MDFRGLPIETKKTLLARSFNCGIISKRQYETNLKELEEKGSSAKLIGMIQEKEE